MFKVNDKGEILEVSETDDVKVIFNIPYHGFGFNETLIIAVLKTLSYTYYNKEDMFSGVKNKILFAIPPFSAIDESVDELTETIMNDFREIMYSEGEDVSSIEELKMCSELYNALYEYCKAAFNHLQLLNIKSLLDLSIRGYEIDSIINCGEYIMVEMCPSFPHDEYGINHENTLKI